MTSEQPPEAASRPSRGLVLAVSAVLAVLLAVVATVLLWPEKKPAALPPPPAPTTSSPAPTPTPTPTPSPTATRVVPYTFFPVGSCFDHPQLNKTVTKPEARPCEGEHDGEAIADLLLPEGLTGDSQISKAMREGCQAVQAAAEARQGGGGPYYGYPFGPSAAYYQQGWRDFTCTLTASNRPGGVRLSGHLR